MYVEILLNLVSVTKIEPTLILQHSSYKNWCIK